MSDESPMTIAYGNFLARREFETYRNSIMLIVDDGYELGENKQENFKSKKHFLAANIGYLKQYINDHSSNEKEIEDLNKLEIEYKTL